MVFGFGKPNVQKLKEKRDVEGLIKALGYEKKRFVRVEAAKALGKIGDSRAVGPLISALSNNDYYVRWEAAKALGKIGDSRAVGPLISALSDSARIVREEAAVSLGVFR